MPRRGACCELSWCEPVEARVRSVGVVVDPPCFDDLARLVEVGEQVLVEALVAQPAVVADDHAWAASRLDDAVELAHDTWGGERGVHHQAEAFSGAVIDQGEDTEAPAARQRVYDEVE